MHDTLKQFLVEWHAWATGGAARGNPVFSRATGLCTSWTRWLKMHNIEGLKEKLHERFQETDVDVKLRAFPFGGSRTFEIECNNELMHTNPLRLQWVKEQIG